MRERSIVAGVLALACGPAGEATPECPGAGVVLSGETAVPASGVEAECLVIAAGSTLRIEEARTTVLRARTVVIEGDAIVVGSGIPRAPDPSWTSGGANCSLAHFNWEDAVRQHATQPELTDRGRDGGVFVLRYGRVSGGAARLALLRFDLAGGPGSRGRELRCGCVSPAHASHVAREPDGPTGLPGTWRFIEESP